MTLPADHPLRRRLADEVHARPPAAVCPPAVVSCLALTHVPPDAVLERVAELATAHGLPAPAASAAHAILDLPEVRLKWERHGEFASLVAVRALPGATLESTTAFPSAFDALPANWLAALPGRAMTAADIAILPSAEEAPGFNHVARWFDPDTLAGARVLDEAARVYTDFRLQDDGRTRWLIVEHGMGAAQAARVAQRVVEIEIYRMMALLAFPLARAAFPELDRIEQRLAEIASATEALHARLGTLEVRNEERRLLDVLTQIAAEVERSVAATAFRFSAGQAYWEIVRARVAEFREQRIGDMRTLGGFLARRMAPAMNSCAAAARRQEELSARVERASALLRTRVDIAREEQNLELLAAMERRGKVALRLQQTVEGLSVAALTYYAAGLIGYMARPLAPIWPWLQVDWLVAAAVPVVGYLVWRSVRRIRQALDRD